MKTSVNAITFDVSILNNIHEAYAIFGALSLAFLLSLSFFGGIDYLFDTHLISMYKT